MVVYLTSALNISKPIMTKKIVIKLLLVAFIFGFSTESSAQFWKKKETPKAAVKPKPKKKRN